MRKTEREEDGLIKAVDVDAFIVPENPNVPVMTLKLEDGEDFYLYNVPYDIVDIIKRIKEDNVIETIVKRESIFDLIYVHDDLRNILEEDLEKVVIDEFDPETMLFTASVYFSNGAARIVKRMIPSHAVYLALIAGKPIYVSRKIVELERDVGGDWNG